MTPSDNAQRKERSLPAPVSSASSLDSLSLHHHHLGTDQTFDLSSLVNDPTRNNISTNDLSRGDHHQDAAPGGLQPAVQQQQQQPAQQQQQQQGQVVSPAMNTMIEQPSVPSMVLPANNHLGVPVLPSGTPLTMPGTAGNNSIPEFLYQLTKMLTDNNRHVIEWTNGKIEVHSPHRLEQEVLHKYFRHSKFASFQRQLNYFGFRKQAGKGKMAPCSYANEAISHDLSSILLIKRKTSASIAASAKDKEKKKEPPSTDTKPSSTKASGDSTGVNPVLAGILQRSNSMPASSASSAVNTAKPATSAKTSEPGDSYKAVAKSAVGRGIRHSFMSPASFSASSVASAALPDRPASESKPSQPSASGHDSLSQLATNYRNSLNEFGEDRAAGEQFDFDTDPTPLSQLQADGSSSSGFFNQDSSLLDLAMLPEVDETEGDDSSNMFNFVDFPNPEVRPKSSEWDGGF